MRSPSTANLAAASSIVGRARVKDMFVLRGEGPVPAPWALQQRICCMSAAREAELPLHCLLRYVVRDKSQCSLALVEPRPSMWPCDHASNCY